MGGTRPWQWIVTIPLLDQWLDTIGNHGKTIISCPMVVGLQNHQKTIGTNGCWTKNHWKIISTNSLQDQKPSVPMVCQTKNHWKTIVTNGWNVKKKKHRKTIENNGSLIKKTIEKPLTIMVPWQKPLTIPSCPKIYHRYGPGRTFKGRYEQL